MDVEQDRVAARGVEAERSHQPRLDLRAVCRDGREALRLRQLATARERRRHLGQAGLVQIELRRSGRAGRDVDDPAVHGVEAGDAQLSVHDRLRGAASAGAHPVQMPVAAVLEHEQERVAVPDGLTNLGIRGAVPVERVRQDRRRSRLRVEDRDLAVARVVEPARSEAAGDPRAVRRPGGSLVPGIARGERHRLAALGVDEEDVSEELDIPVRLARGGERDALAVRRPLRMLVFEVPVGELRGRGRAVGRNREDVPAAVADPALAVELELEPGKAPGPPSPLVFLLVGRVGNAGGERQAGPVRSPDRLGHVLGEIGEPTCLAAGRRDDVQLLRLAVAVRDEREAAPVRRPAGSEILLVARRELLCRPGAAQGHPQDRARVVVRLAVDAPRHDRGGRGAGRDPRICHPAEVVQVFRAHRLPK